MLVFGEYQCLTNRTNLIVLNLSSLIEGFERVNVIPPFRTGYNDEKDFDVIYANYLLSDDVAFYEMMKIVMSLYYGCDVYILVTMGGIYDYVAESLQKFLQQRYGINSYIINDPDDWEFVSTTDSFSLNGLYNLDIDKEKFSLMYAKYNDINKN